MFVFIGDYILIGVSRYKLINKYIFVCKKIKSDGSQKVIIQYIIVYYMIVKNNLFNRYLSIYLKEEIILVIWFYNK